MLREHVKLKTRTPVHRAIASAHYDIGRQTALNALQCAAGLAARGCGALGTAGPTLGGACLLLHLQKLDEIAAGVYRRIGVCRR